ncbi:MAG: hypothetical protein ABGY24_06355 [bacterium]
MNWGSAREAVQADSGSTRVPRQFPYNKTGLGLDGFGRVSPASIV